MATNVARIGRNSVGLGAIGRRLGHRGEFVLPTLRRTMPFKPGDRVVYPHHGAAVIEKKETREAFGRKTEYLVLRMAHGEMTLAVPVDKVDDVGMRWPISGDDVDDLFDVLKKRDVREPSNWSRRFKNHQEKLKSGDVYQVAEVVRNLALRDKDKGLSAGEKTLYQKARSVLVSELSFALDVTEDDAMDKVDAALE
jgi:CarD family transcriptional regulator